MPRIINDFIYRNDGRPTWNIVIIEEDKSVTTCTMTEAIAAGCSLPEIISAINADILTEVERLRAKNRELQTTLQSNS